jgi:hypothetical protein
MVFDTIIPRNVKLSESPSFGLPAIMHDADSKGAISYLNLAREIVEKNACFGKVEQDIRMFEVRLFEFRNGKVKLVTGCGNRNFDFLNAWDYRKIEYRKI